MKQIITISRQYGSGGREIGQALAEHYHIPFYDKNVAELSAAVTGFTTKVIENLEDSVPSILSYQYYGFLPQPMPLSDQVFFAQSEVIRKVADAGPCVIVGRCADYILRELPNCVNVYIYSDMEDRVYRATTYYNLSADRAKEQIQKMDKKRATYYNFYTNLKWGRAENYDLSLNSAKVGIEGCVNVICRFVERAEAMEAAKDQK